MQQIYRTSNFIEITLRHRCSPVHLPHIFRTPFTKSTSGWLILSNLSINITNINENNIQINIKINYNMFKILYEKILKYNLNIKSTKLNSLFKKIEVVIARCRVEYGKNFPSFSYVATYFTSL